MAKKKQPAADAPQVTHSAPSPTFPPLTQIERHICGNEFCQATLEEGDVFDVPWIDDQKRFRRTRGYRCSKCGRSIGCSLFYDGWMWRYVVQLHELKMPPTEFIKLDQSTGGQQLGR